MAPDRLFGGVGRIADRAIRIAPLLEVNRQFGDGRAAVRAKGGRHPLGDPAVELAAGRGRGAAVEDALMELMDEPVAARDGTVRPLGAPASFDQMAPACEVVESRLDLG